MSFSTSIRGYSKDEVEKFIRQLKSDYEKSLSQQKQRIEQLKAALSEAEAKLNEHKSRDELISKAIINAVAKANDIERVAKEKYDMEIAQLKAFHAKWNEYYDALLKKYPLNEELNEVNDFNAKMNTILNKHGKSKVVIKAVAQKQQSEDYDENYAAYEDEKQRLGKAGGVNMEAVSKVMQNDEPEEKYERMMQKMSGKAFNPMDNIKEYFKAEGVTPPVNEDGFDYEEAQNPKESLEDIMKDLGLL